VRAGEAKAPAQTTGLVPTWSALSKGSVERPTPLPRKVLTFAPTGADKPAQSYADKPAQSYAGRTPGFVTPAARLPALEVGKVPKMQPMSEPPGGGGTAEPLLDAGDEKQRVQDKAARDLMAAAGGPNAFAAFRARKKGRLASSTAQREERVVRLLVRSGGVGGKMNTDLRLTLNDWRAMLTQQESPVGAPPPDLFPIGPEDAMELQMRLEEADQPTAAARVPGSLEYGKAVGLDVEPSPAMALVRPLAHETKSKKRAAMPPMAVLLLENAACEPPPEYSEQLIEYTRHLYMMLVANTRAKNFHTWKLKETKPKDDLICLVFVGDDPKAKKLGVHQYVPAGGLARGPLLWQQSYAERLTGRAFTCADWLAPAKKKIDASTGWADGMAPNKKAMDGLKSAAAAALGVSEEFMREIGISGTHTRPPRRRHGHHDPRVARGRRVRDRRLGPAEGRRALEADAHE
jgi:hypothetical protein